jgi:hypothetical protein
MAFSRPPDLAEGRNKRSASAFEYGDHELSSISQNAKRLCTEPNSAFEHRPQPSAGNKHSASDFELDNDEFAASTQDSKRLRAEGVHGGISLPRANLMDELEEASMKIGSTASTQSTFRKAKPQTKQTRPRYRQSLHSHSPVNQSLAPDTALQKLYKEFPDLRASNSLRLFMDRGMHPVAAFHHINPTVREYHERGDLLKAFMTLWGEQKNRMVAEQHFTTLDSKVDLPTDTASMAKEPMPPKAVSDVDVVEPLFPNSSPQSGSSFSLQPGQNNTGHYERQVKETSPHRVAHEEPESHGALPPTSISISSDKLPSEWPENISETEGDDTISTDAQLSQDGGEVAATLEPETDENAAELHHLIWHEIGKQQVIICGPPGHLPEGECNQRMLDILANVHRPWEAVFLAALGKGEEDITMPKPAKSPLHAMVMRMEMWLTRMILKAYPPPSDTDSRSYKDHQELATRKARYLHLSFLQRRTTEWQEEFSDEKEQRNFGEGTQGGEPSSPALENPALLQSEPQSFRESPSRQPSPPACHVQRAKGKVQERELETDQEVGSRLPQQPSRNESSRDRPCPRIQLDTPPFQAKVSQTNNFGDLGKYRSSVQQASQQGSQHGLQVLYSYHTHVQSQYNASSNRLIQGAHTQPLPGQSNGLSNHALLSGAADQSATFGVAPATTVPGQHFGAAGATQRSHVVHQQQPVAQNPQGQPTTKKRGAPRKRMFIHAPSSDTPLPPLAIINDDEILSNCPEHLSNPDVMRRFVQSAPSGGHSTNSMVKSLLSHAIKDDFHGTTAQNLSEKERRATIKRWVIKERDNCNKASHADRERASAATSVVSTPNLRPASLPPTNLVASYVGPQMNVQAGPSVIATSNPPRMPQVVWQSMQPTAAMTQGTLHAQNETMAPFRQHASTDQYPYSEVGQQVLGLGTPQSGNAAQFRPYETPLTAPNFFDYALDSLPLIAASSQHPKSNQGLGNGAPGRSQEMYRMHTHPVVEQDLDSFGADHGEVPNAIDDEVVPGNLEQGDFNENNGIEGKNDFHENKSVDQKKVVDARHTSSNSGFLDSLYRELEPECQLSGDQ